MHKKDGSLLIISGPSGSGKSSLLEKLFQKIPNLDFSISTTTRAKRGQEKDNIDYIFTSKEQFEKDIKKDKFAEYANVHGNYYGTSKALIDESIKNQKTLVFDIDVQGKMQLDKLYPKYITSIFVLPPSLKILKQRLTNRKTDTDEVIEKRLKNAQDEIDLFNTYDYLLINDDFDTTLKELESIVNTIQYKSSLINKNEFLQKWKGKD